MKIAQSFKNLLRRIKNGFLRFAPVHVAVVLIAALFIADNHHLIGSAAILHNWIRGIFWGALAGIFVTLLGEYKEWKLKNLLLYSTLATILISTIGTLFWFHIGENSPRFGQWTMLYWGAVISLFSASVAILYRSVETRSLVAKLALNLLASIGSTAIIMASLLICLYAFDSLVMEVNHRIYTDIFRGSWALIPTIGYLSFLPRRGDSDNSSERAIEFLFWLLLPASILLLGILYLYLGRILNERAMPSGTLNWFGSITLALYTFFWLALRESPRHFFRAIVRWGWAFILPVLVLQIVGIVIRFEAHGLTILRAAGMVTLLFGIVALVLAAFDRKPFGLFVFISISGLIFTISPLNIADMAVWNQESRLKEALVRNDLLDGSTLKPRKDAELSEKDIEIIVGAWKYLGYDNYGNFGRLRVWRNDEFVRGIRDSLKSGFDIIDTLGIDRDKLDKTEARRGKWVWERIEVSANASFDISGCNRLKILGNYVAVANLVDGRWKLSLKQDNNKTEIADITEKVNGIFEKVGLTDGRYRNNESTINAEDAVIMLEGKGRIIFGAIQLHGLKGDKIDTVHFEKAAMVSYDGSDSGL